MFKKHNIIHGSLSGEQPLIPQPTQKGHLLVSFALCCASLIDAKTKRSNLIQARYADCNWSLNWITHGGGDCPRRYFINKINRCKPTINNHNWLTNWWYYNILSHQTTIKCVNTVSFLSLKKILRERIIYIK